MRFVVTLHRHKGLQYRVEDGQTPQWLQLPALNSTMRALKKINIWLKEFQWYMDKSYRLLNPKEGHLGIVTPINNHLQWRRSEVVYTYSIQIDGSLPWKFQPSLVIATSIFFDQFRPVLVIATSKKIDLALTIHGNRHLRLFQSESLYALQNTSDISKNVCESQIHGDSERQDPGKQMGVRGDCPMKSIYFLQALPSFFGNVWDPVEFQGQEQTFCNPTSQRVIIFHACIYVHVHVHVYVYMLYMFIISIDVHCTWNISYKVRPSSYKLVCKAH